MEALGICPCKTVRFLFFFFGGGKRGGGGYNLYMIEEDCTSCTAFLCLLIILHTARELISQVFQGVMATEIRGMSDKNENLTWSSS